MDRAAVCRSIARADPQIQIFRSATDPASLLLSVPAGFEPNEGLRAVFVSFDDLLSSAGGAGSTMDCRLDCGKSSNSYIIRRSPVGPDTRDSRFLVRAGSKALW